MSKLLNKDTGRRGEQAAAELLQKKGYEIVDRNYRNKWGEIDIIAKQGRLIAFIEVKTKTGNQFGEPWEMVNGWKKSQVERIGLLWCEERGWEGLCRVDVIGVWITKDGTVEATEHWENVTI